MPNSFRLLSSLQALADFMSMLGQDPARAFYGPGHVRAAHELGAIQVGEEAAAVAAVVLLFA
jgi:stalled ribosome rescue protein Dom34